MIKNKSNKYSRGFGIVGLLIYLFIFMAIFLGIDVAYIFYSQRCFDTPVFECFKDFAKDEESINAVVAKGSFNYNKYDVTLTLTIPLDGGKVTGSFDGSCDGTIQGNYDGEEGGVITGKAKGSCGLVIPASGSFSGTVSQTSKSVPISGTGTVAGVSGEGSLSLSY